MIPVGRTTARWGLTALAGAALSVGYGNLWIGGTSVAAVLLTVAYLVALPATLWTWMDRPALCRETDRRERPPFAVAAATALAVFAMYLATLAPGTALWDSSEYIAVAYNLGIPHPPGNPLFVLVAHAFGLLPLPVSYAARINVLSALASAIAAGLWMLVAHEALRGWKLPPRVRQIAAALTALLIATSFTIWSQSVVSQKVYSLGMVGVALVSWIALRWKDAPQDSPRSDALLVLAVYVCALGFANHTAGLLPLPALALAVLVKHPGVLRRLRPVRTALLAALLGISPFVYQPIRASHQPFINQGSPSACTTGPHADCMFSIVTWKRLRSQLTREQYGGHAVAARQAPLAVQVALWWRYFQWQWWRDGLEAASAWQQGIAVLFLALAALGGLAHWQRDRSSFIYFGALIATTTPALIYYLNLGYGPNQFTELAGTVVREGVDRDYFFVWSFAALAVWVGLGITTLWQWSTVVVQRRIAARAHASPSTRPVSPAAAATTWWMAAPVLLLAAIPFVGNYRHASRRTHTLARAWAIDVLLSVEPYGILISNGDNDTFPLWYAQEVEGVRRDVRVVLAPYLKSDWYARQLRILRVRAYRDDGLPEYRALVGPTPRTGPLTLSDAEADAVPQQQPLGNAREFISGKMHATLRADTITRDQALVLQLIRDVFPRRSIYFTVGQYAQELGLGDYIATQGLVQRLLEQPAHTDPRLVAFPGGHLDVERTRALWARYRGQHDLLDESARVDAMPSGIPVVYNVTMQLLAYGLAQRGDASAAQHLLLANAALMAVMADSPSPALRPAR